MHECLLTARGHGKAWVRAGVTFTFVGHRSGSIMRVATVRDRFGGIAHRDIIALTACIIFGLTGATT
jgi:hypothetical protein